MIIDVTETSPEAKLYIQKSIANAIKNRLKPPPTLDLVEWADTYRFLPDNSAESGRWKTDRVLVAKQPMLSITTREVQEVTIMCCIQLMKTELMLNTALYYMHQEPSPIMYIAPKKDLAEAWSKERLVKSVSATPVIKDIFSGNRRGEGNTITQKQFAGGQISIVSARNPSDLAMRACRILLFDECDKYPANAGSGADGGGEGDPISISWGRATTYGKRAKKITACSPTVKGKSRIEAEYFKSNMSIYQLRCPHCLDLQTVEWENVIIPKHEDKTFDHQKAQICCPDCGTFWTESDRHKAIRNGEWLIRKPQITWHHGYHVSALASPFTPIPTLAKEFNDALGNIEAMKAFKNTRLAETWKEAGERPEWRVLYDRRTDYKFSVIPKGGVLLTCGIDVQKDCLYYEIVAWGLRNESWSIAEGIIAGSIEEDETKEALTLFCDATYPDENGYQVPVGKVCIDSGYNTNEVYSFVRQYGSDRVVAIKGQGNQDTVLGTPRAVDVTINGKRLSRGLTLWNVGSSVLKEQFYRWLGGVMPTEEKLKEGRLVPSGYCNFPMYGEEYFKQITSEQLITRTNNRGFTSSEWEKTRKDNHLLDCRVYARAGAVMLQIDRMVETDFLAILDARKPLETEVIIQRGMNRKNKKAGWIKR